MKVAKLHNRIQDFAWGSESYLPQLLGYQNPEQKPQAELWMGVHPLGESRVDGVDTLLSEYLQEAHSPNENKDENTQNSLPFLFKVLAAKQPLSIQVHPNKDPGAGRLSARKPRRDCHQRPKPQLQGPQPQTGNRFGPDPVLGVVRIPPH